VYLPSAQRAITAVERLLTELSEVVRPPGILPWLQQPNDACGGLKPVEVMERGETDSLWRVIYFLGSGPRAERAVPDTGASCQLDSRRKARAEYRLFARDHFNKKELTVSGGSQGGALTLIASGLDLRVTPAAPNVAAMSDHSGMASTSPASSRAIGPRRRLHGHGVRPQHGLRRVQRSSGDPRCTKARAVFRGQYGAFSLDATFAARESVHFLRATADNRCRCARNAKECRDGGATLQGRQVCKRNRAWFNSG